MRLPVRILDAPPAEPLVGVDGLVGVRGLELSHWPGNRTPRALRHRLSTGSALAFARLPQQERERLAAGATALANNHYDTDGTLALFATRFPAEALAREARLLAAAEAGDFFAFPSDEALALDALVHALADPELSPWRAELGGRSDRERHEQVTLRLLEELPALLDEGLARYRALWEPTLAAAQADRADLARAAHDEVVHLDLAVWTAPRGAISTRARPQGEAPACFDPGRHALFATGELDRALAIGPGAAGTSYRLIVSTRSWFDLDGPPRLPRPRLDELAARLNALEGTRADEEAAWRAQAPEGASPELWFGTAEHEAFAEHAPALRPSALEPGRVRREIADALRAALPC